MAVRLWPLADIKPIPTQVSFCRKGGPLRQGVPWSRELAVSALLINGSGYQILRMKSFS